MADTWRPGFLDHSPMLSPLQRAGASLARMKCWPGLDEYNRLLSEGPAITTTGYGKPVSFVPQDSKPQCMEKSYEGRIYLSGEVQTRTKNWHDLFNVLVWLAFPRTKSALNARHFEAITQASGSMDRGRIRDTLTLFDESGVAVVYADDEMAQLLCDFRWKELFWARRRGMQEHMKFVVFGHSLHEKALNPYIGLTGKGLLLKVETDFFSLPPKEQGQTLDNMMAARFSGAVQFGSGELTPVPLLGVPGWWRDNKNAAFYDNTAYFRPQRAKSKEATPPIGSAIHGKASP